MAKNRPRPISSLERRRRLARIRKIAARLGFAGSVEYRHVHGGTGGAQYGLGVEQSDDVVVGFAEAFDRDRNPEDYSLEAILAHERGHQLLAWHPRMRQILARWNGHASEELLASVLGSLIVEREKDQRDLLIKAVGEALLCGVEPVDAVWLVTEIRGKLETLL
ncbi:MAG: hypothetical protein HY040_00295 [Planctomycetes bacterium]|nr:hypothetical protein [Planctomycetota bacterium]